MSSCVGQLRSSAIGLAEHFDAAALSGPDAVQVVDDLAVVRNIVDGLLAAAAKRVEDTGAHVGSGALDAPNFVAGMTHTPVRAVRDAIDTAAKLEVLPATAEKVRSGELSGAQAQMIAAAAAVNPLAERSLLEKAPEGLRRLRAACNQAMADVEDADERAARQKSLVKLNTWTDSDGLGAGQFRFLPQDFAAFNAILEAETDGCSANMPPRRNICRASDTPPKHS